MEINNNRKDWALERLGDFAVYEKGKMPKNQSPLQTDIFKYPYVNIQAFEKGIIEAYTDGEKCNFCSENDFLMVWDGSRFGLIGKGIKGAIGSTLMKINFPGIENHFAYYFLKSKYLEINSKPKGTGTPHVNPELLWNYIFPIAPLPEQRAIVSKIEQLFSDLDNGIENFKKAQAQMKRYRKSVLKAACEGKLVPTEAELACAQGRDYEAADVLLVRILKERREKWNGKGKYKEPAVPDTNGLPELPKGWGWASIEQVTECLDHMRIPVNKIERAKRKGNIPYYGANGLVDFIDDYIFDEPLVLIVEDETFIGREKPFCYKITGKSWVNNHAHILRANNAVNVDFLNYSLMYYPFTPLTTGTTGRKKLTKSVLMQAPYSLPPLAEQCH